MFHVTLRASPWERGTRDTLTVLHVQQQSHQCSQLKQIQLQIASLGNLMYTLW